MDDPAFRLTGYKNGTPTNHEATAQSAREAWTQYRYVLGGMVGLLFQKKCDRIRVQRRDGGGYADIFPYELRELAEAEISRRERLKHCSDRDNP